MRNIILPLLIAFLLVMLVSGSKSVPFKLNVNMEQEEVTVINPPFPNRRLVKDGLLNPVGPPRLRRIREPEPEPVAAPARNVRANISDIFGTEPANTQKLWNSGENEERVIQGFA